MRTPDLLDALAGHIDVEAPEGMILGWRSIRPDLRSRDGFRWPWPGGWAEAPDEACPSGELGGLCLAKTWSGARSGGARSRGVPAHIGLVVAYHPDDVLGEDAHKLRVRRCLVLDVVDVCAHIRAGHCTGANLDGADLTGAYLGGAYLTGADLGGANLDGAYRSLGDPPIPGWNVVNDRLVAT